MDDVRFHAPAAADLTGLIGSVCQLVDLGGGEVGINTTSTAPNATGVLVTEGVAGAEVEIVVVGFVRVVTGGVIAVGDRLGVCRDEWRQAQQRRTRNQQPRRRTPPAAPVDLKKRAECAPPTPCPPPIRRAGER